MKRKILIGIGSIATLLVLAGGWYWFIDDTPGISFRSYCRIGKGTTYSDVCKLFGGPAGHYRKNPTGFRNVGNVLNGQTTECWDSDYGTCCVNYQTFPPHRVLWKTWTFDDTRWPWSWFAGSVGSGWVELDGP